MSLHAQSSFRGGGATNTTLDLWIETGAPSISQDQSYVQLVRSHLNSEGCCYCNGPANACWPIWSIVAICSFAVALLALVIFQAYHLGKRAGYDTLSSFAPCLRREGSAEADESQKAKASSETTSLQQ